MDLVEARAQKRRRSVTNRHGLVHTEEDMSDAVEVGEHCKDENLGKRENVLDSGDLVTDDDDDNDDIEGDYDAYGACVGNLTRRPGHQDEINRAAMKIDKCTGGPRKSRFTYFKEGEWSMMGVLVQLISVKIIKGAGKYLFGKILSANYWNEYLSFYNRERERERESNDCKILDGKGTKISIFHARAVASLCRSHQVLQIIDELDIYVDLSTRDSEWSEEREVGRGVIHGRVWK
uniref:Uncharacterized protein n=1 Tax=Arundo donax TaxID=35708 RepID=A0A0A9DCU7_ARUDO